MPKVNCRQASADSRSRLQGHNVTRPVQVDSAGLPLEFPQQMTELALAAVVPAPHALVQAHKSVGQHDVAKHRPRPPQRIEVAAIEAVHPSQRVRAACAASRRHDLNRCIIRRNEVLGGSNANAENQAVSSIFPWRIGVEVSAKIAPKPRFGHDCQQHVGRRQRRQIVGGADIPGRRKIDVMNQQLRSPSQIILHFRRAGTNVAWRVRLHIFVAL